jgi:hypothetical protein
MKSSRSGTSTFSVRVGGITARGFWLLIDAQKVFVSYREFPWFREFTPNELARVCRPFPNHIRWPDFDIDLLLDSIRHPARYPLVEKRLRGDPAQVIERLRHEKKRAAGSC